MIMKGSDRPYHFPDFPIKILKEIPNDYVNEPHPKDYLTKYPTNHTLLFLFVYFLNEIDWFYPGVFL